MARYIDACLAIQYIRDHYCELDFMDSGVPAEMERVVQSIPTEDVKPVVHAHWREYIPREFCCSHCEYIALYDVSPDWGKDMEIVLTDFCPHCGAIMDEEVDNE